jgi:retron-type reverse transcriptase
MIFFNAFVDSRYNKKVLSWEKSDRILRTLQNRLYKAIFVGDIRKSLSLQNLILISSCSRLLAIREVTQISLNKKISGIDGKTSLSFIERFHLNEFLRRNFNNWMPQSLKKFFFVDKNGLIKTLKVSTISDRAWQVLIRFALEPAHEAVFNPRNYGFRLARNIHDTQKFFLLNLDRSALGIQKRILLINLEQSIFSFNINFLVKILIAPRSIKLGIFRTLKKGFSLSFSDDSSCSTYSLSSLLLNILLDGIESIHHSLRFGYSLVYFLKPLDDEVKIIESIKHFLSIRGLSLREDSIRLFSASKGFSFLGWHFKFSNKKNIISVPSIDNYNNLLTRVKYIINNSNYGSIVKVNKLYPIIKSWKLYHRFSVLRGPRFSLFFIKKKAFKIFNQESRQDFYSSKKLLDKCFSYSVIDDKKISLRNNILHPYSHITFSINSFLLYYKYLLPSDHNKYFCIHCGIKFTYS